MEVENQRKQDMKRANFRLKIIFVIILLIIAVINLILHFKLLTHFEDGDISCDFSSKFNKFTCIQIGEVVPDWFDINKKDLSNLMMKLIIEDQKHKTYSTIDMTDCILIPGYRRKFIYEVKEQTLADFHSFKKALHKGKKVNWGSLELYCSDDNQNESVCKTMKKYHK